MSRCLYEETGQSCSHCGRGPETEAAQEYAGKVLEAHNRRLDKFHEAMDERPWEKEKVIGRGVPRNRHERRALAAKRGRA